VFDFHHHVDELRVSTRTRVLLVLGTVAGFLAVLGVAALWSIVDVNTSWNAYFSLKFFPAAFLYACFVAELWIARHKLNAKALIDVKQQQQQQHHRCVLSLLTMLFATCYATLATLLFYAFIVAEARHYHARLMLPAVLLSHALCGGVAVLLIRRCTTTTTITRSGFVRIWLGTAFPVLQFFFSMAFGYYIGRVPQHGIVLFCLSYPVCILVFRTASRLAFGRFFSEAVSYAHTLCAALPYRYIFPVLISSWYTFALVLLVELFYKLVVYGFALKVNVCKQNKKTKDDKQRCDSVRALSVRFFLQGVTDLFAIFGTLVLLVISRAVGGGGADDTLAGALTRDAYTRLLVLYAIATAFELLLFPALLVLLRERHFNPLHNSVFYMRHFWLSTITISMFAFVAVTLVLDPFSAQNFAMKD
jgi:hypothetical protein